MRHITTVIFMTLSITPLLHAVRYGPVTVHKDDDTTMKVYLHADGYQYAISDSVSNTTREAVTVLTDASDVLGDNIYKAWYDYENTLVYVTNDNTMSVIYPVYSICSLTRHQTRTDKQDKYVGIHPNPNYRMEPSSFMIAGPGSPHCFVYTKGAPHKANTIQAQAPLVETE